MRSVCLAAVFPWLALGQAAVANDPRIDAAVRQAIKTWGVPGTAVVIVQDGKVIHQAGYGVTSVDQPTAVTAETIFPLGSCTKAFTAALLATYVADGKASFDDPVRKHLPDFRLADPKADAQVTLRDLLGHRTGVDSHEFLWFKAPWNQVESVRRMRYLPQQAPFRESYHYSTLNYLALGQALEAIGGQPWERLVRGRIFEPLGMTGVAVKTPPGAGRALGHRRMPAGRIERMPEYELNEPNPAGSLFLPAASSAPWMIAHLKPGPVVRLLGDLHRPLTLMPLSDPAIAVVYPDSGKVSYAMGWVAYDWRGIQVLGHGGILDGFRSQILLFPQAKLGIALYGNLHQSKMNIALGHDLAAVLLNLPHKRNLTMHYRLLENAEACRKTDALAKRNAERHADRLPGWPSERYLGSYRHVAYGDFTVARLEGELEWKWSGFRGRLEPFQAEAFRTRDGDFTDELVEFRSRATGPDAVRFNGIVFTR